MFKPKSASSTTVPPTLVGFPKGELSVTMASERNNAPSVAKSAMAKFNDTDLKKIGTLKDQLLKLDNNAVLNFGSDVQTEVADISDKILEHTKSKDFEFIGSKLTDVIIHVRGIQPNGKSGIPLIGGLIDKVKNSKERIQANFETASQQIDKLVKEVDSTRTNIASRLKVLDDLYHANLRQYHELDLHVHAAKLAIEDFSSQTESFAATITPESDPFDVQQLNDAKQQLTNMSIMVSTLERIGMTAVQTAPQIRQMQQNAMQIVDHFKMVSTHIVPGWKRQFAIAVMMDEQKRGAELANTLTDLSNNIARENATALRQTTVNVAKSNQRGVIDLSTLEFVQQELIGGIEDVIKINTEGEVARKQVSARIGEMKQQLNVKLT